MTDNLSAADAAYRAQMTAASAKLAGAIMAAKQGLYHYTPRDPVKLPQDYSNASGPKADNRSRRLRDVGSIKYVDALMQRGFGCSEIAERIGVSTQRASAMMQRICNRKAPDELDLAIKKKLWG